MLSIAKTCKSECDMLEMSPVTCHTGQCNQCGFIASSLTAAADHRCFQATAIRCRHTSSTSTYRREVDVLAHQDLVVHRLHVRWLQVCDSELQCNATAFRSAIAENHTAIIKECISGPKYTLSEKSATLFSIITLATLGGFL